MQVAYFDCFSGVSGDMLLSALVDAGFPFSKLKSSLKPLIRPYKVSLNQHRVKRCGLSGLKIDITDADPVRDRSRFWRDRKSETPTSTLSKNNAKETVLDKMSLISNGADKHLSLNEISGAIRKARLPKPVKTDSLKILNRIADAEARVHHHHHHASKDIRLHELGSVDTLIDIVGASLGIHYLGVERIYVSALPLNKGKVRCAHGLYPLPAPGTLELLKGFELFKSPIKKELVTPTGAAILTTLGKPSNVTPQFNISRIGYGAGTIDLPHKPNILRVFIGEASASNNTEKDTICVLETNIDNTTGEVIGYTVEKLFSHGALDVFTLPIQMKKSRPGVLLQVLSPIDLVSKMEGIIFSELPTLGIRKYLTHRAKLKREIRRVKTRYGAIRVKVSQYGQDARLNDRGGQAEHVSPEYEDCRKAAQKYNVPLRQVISEALGKK